MTQPPADQPGVPKAGLHELLPAGHSLISWLTERPDDPPPTITLATPELGIPDGWEQLPYPYEVMTNCDLSIDERVAERLKHSDCWGEHAAWNFHGRVWFQEGRWHERVSVYHQLAGCYSADSLVELMKTVNEAHGWA